MGFCVKRAQKKKKTEQTSLGIIGAREAQINQNEALLKLGSYFARNLNWRPFGGHDGDLCPPLFKKREPSKIQMLGAGSAKPFFLFFPPRSRPSFPAPRFFLEHLLEDLSGRES